MTTLKIIWYNYKLLLIINNVSQRTNFIHIYWQPNNLSNLSPWYVSCLNSLFQVIEITAYQQGVFIL